MAERELTPEEQAAWDKANQIQTKVDAPVEEPQPAPTENLAEVDVSALLRRIEELERSRYQPSQPQITQRGMVGTLEKFSVNPNDYPNPIERLSKESRLQRFAFNQNYELSFKVSTSTYQTIDGINTKEPKFELELSRIVFGENGEPTEGRYSIRKAVFHEDPNAALVVARENGLDVPEHGEKDFLDEMRYLRMRDWLLEAFYPPKPSQEKVNRREMVIDGKVVEYYEINSENSEVIPFGQLKTKV